MATNAIDWGRFIHMPGVQGGLPALLDRGVMDAAVRAGYQGPNIFSGQGLPTDAAMLAQQLGVDLGAMTEAYGGPDAAVSPLSDLQNAYSYKSLQDWARSNGLDLGSMQTGNVLQQTLADGSGNVLGQDSYDWDAEQKKGHQMGMAAFLAPIMAAAAFGGPEAFGIGGGGGVGLAPTGSGAGMLGAGGMPATGIGEMIGANVANSMGLGSVGLGSSLGAAAANGFAQGMGGAAAGAGGLSAGNIMAGLGAAGLGGSLSDAAAEVAAEQIGTGSLVDAGLTGSGPLGNLGGWSDAANAVLGSGGVGGGGFLGQSVLTTGAGASSGLGGLSGLLDGIRSSGVGQAVGSVADAVGGGSNLAAIVGGALGATQGGKTDTATVDRKIDPRLDAMLYGDGGYMSQLQQQFNATRNGNPDMTAGADMLRNLYQSPDYQQGYQQMRSVGQGLLGQGVASNPFTNPGSAPAGLLGAFTPVARGQMPTTGLLPIPTRRGSI